MGEEQGKPDEPATKKYWTLSEISRELGEKPAQLQYWERQAGIVGVQNKANGIKRYVAAEVESFRRLHYLIRVERYSIEGACRQLNEAGPATERHRQTRKTLEEIRALLLHLRENL